MRVRIEYICFRCRHLSSTRSLRQFSSNSTSTLPSTPARTRFAPSPTGNLHLGSIRTALFNYLLAKRTNGQFILRLEDTDEKRTVPGAEQKLYQDLKWAGLQWDEGPEIGGPYGPYRQSDRTSLYQQHAAQLLASAHAYRCFCSPAALRAKAQARAALGQGADYDGTCLHLSTAEADARAHAGEAFVVRMKDPHRRDHHDTSATTNTTNTTKLGEWTDLVHGRMRPRTSGAKRRAGRDAWDDAVLLKSDGRPTYHLANVVDDHYMRVTHVVRGVEWLESTWKHLALYDAFGWSPPAFAHVGLLMDAQRRKLSKREKEFDLEELKQTVLPETLINFLALLGWKHGSKSEVFSMKDLIENFTLDLNNTSPVVSLKKIDFLQPHHAAARVAAGGEPYKQILDSTVAAVFARFSQSDLQSVGVFSEDQLRTRIDAALHSGAQWRSAAEFASSYCYLFSPPPWTDELSKPPKKLVPLFADQDLIQALSVTLKKNCLQELLIKNKDSFNRETLVAGIDNVCQYLVPEIVATSLFNEADAQKLAMLCVRYFLRLWLTGGMSGPGVVDLMLLLGRDECQKRILEPPEHTEQVEANLDVIASVDLL